MMRPPLLNIQDYHVASMAVDPDPDFNPDHGELLGLVTVGFSFELHSENAHFFRGNLNVEFGPNNAGEESNLPFRARIALIGYFQTPIELIDEELPRDLAANALLVLYGIARGIIGQATANASPPSRKLVLPAVVFDNVFEEAVPVTAGRKNDKAEAKSAPRKKSTRKTSRNTRSSNRPK